MRNICPFELVLESKLVADDLDHVLVKTAYHLDAPHKLSKVHRIQNTSKVKVEARVQVGRPVLREVVTVGVGLEYQDDGNSESP